MKYYFDKNDLAFRLNQLPFRYIEIAYDYALLNGMRPASLT